MHGFRDGEGENECKNCPQGYSSSSGPSATRCGEQIKKQLHVLREKKERNKHIGKNKKAHGEGDGYRNI